MPLRLRRERLLLRFAVKVSANRSNTASTLRELDWMTTHPKKKYEPGKEPLNLILQQYLADSGRAPLGPSRPTTPPWHLIPPLTDSSLSQLFFKKTSSVESMKAETLCHMELYDDTMRVFTDASKTLERTLWLPPRSTWRSSTGTTQQG